MKIIGIICLLFNLLLIVNSRRECIHRAIGKGATVCVCNSTYCDNLDPIKKQSKGTVLLYESSNSGDRFKESQLKVNGTQPNNATKKQTITIDMNKKFQKIIGFGGAFTDSTGINIASLPQNMQTSIIDDYFSDTGIEYSVCRVPIAGSDFSTRAYTYDDHDNDVNLTQFALQKEDLVYKIPFMKLAQTKGTHKVKYFGSPWAAPAWMKTNGRINGGAPLKGQPGGEYFKIFANYFVKFLDEYKKNGVDMWGITIVNEPGCGNSPNYSFNCLGFTAESERDFLKMDLGPALTKAGYDKNNLKIMIFDDQRPELPHAADTILKDPESAKYVSGIAFHYYNNKDTNLVNLDTVNHAHPNYFILSTEASESWPGHIAVENWNTAEKYAHDIITDLQHYTTGWVDWNMVLDTEGGPCWVQHRIYAPILVDATKHEYYKQPIFYSLGHYSKFISPDSVKIQSTENLKIDKFETVAFLRPDNAIVVVALNRNTEAVSLTIDDPHNGKITHEVKPRSIQSYIYWN